MTTFTVRTVDTPTGAEIRAAVAAGTSAPPVVTEAERAELLPTFGS